ncbi:MAG: hypothetical protein KDB70_13350 [Mycobacterium sp.]|nr:hypothetical protein [Mycobacterium sp.]
MAADARCSRQAIGRFRRNERPVLPVSTTARRGAAACCAVVALCAAPAGTALADPQPEPEPTPADQPAATPAPEGALHNITYRARIDGLARRATISYRFSDTEVQSADPSMLPGRVFEAQAVLSHPSKAGMRVAIDLPYSANLHCEIEVDDEVVAQADTFVAPRLTRPKDDPDYGALLCGAPVTDTAATVPVDPTVSSPADAASPTGTTE